MVPSPCQSPLAPRASEEEYVPHGLGLRQRAASAEGVGIVYSLTFILMHAINSLFHCLDVSLRMPTLPEAEAACGMTITLEDNIRARHCRALHGTEVTACTSWSRGRCPMPIDRHDPAVTACTSGAGAADSCLTNSSHAIMNLLPAEHDICT